MMQLKSRATRPINLREIRKVESVKAKESSSACVVSSGDTVDQPPC